MMDIWTEIYRNRDAERVLEKFNEGAFNRALERITAERIRRGFDDPSAPETCQSYWLGLARNPNCYSPNPGQENYWRLHALLQAGECLIPGMAEAIQRKRDASGASDESYRAWCEALDEICELSQRARNALCQEIAGVDWVQ